MTSEFVGPSWEVIEYGNTCLAEDQLPAKLPDRGKGVACKMVALTIGVFAAVHTVQVPAANAYFQKYSSPSSESLLYENFSVDWGAKVKRVREHLRLDQQEAADLLGIGISTLQKLEGGETSTPQAETLGKYVALLEMQMLLDRSLKKKRYAAVAAFRTELPAFGNRTAIDFAKGRAEGVQRVLAVFRRMYE